jgi:hypothetical protein
MVLHLPLAGHEGEGKEMDDLVMHESGGGESASALVWLCGIRRWCAWVLPPSLILLVGHGG